jgi:hypothetical protein
MLMVRVTTLVTPPALTALVRRTAPARLDSSFAERS